MKILKEILTIEKKPKKGLLAMEWVMFGYLLLTMLIIFFCYTKVQNPHAMITGRIQIAVTTLLMWGVYRMVPCRLVMLLRVIVQMAFLSWWYPDTYELNRVLPNFDHLFATWEQQLFGCQPALLFYEAVPSVFFSELMLFGYASYYPMIGVVALYYFFRRYQDFERITFIILASFFIYYVIFIALPVTGPQYYYHAAGLDNIVKGVFPDIGNYFATHQDKLPIPGSPNGFFHQLMEAAHETGERPTAAFPSSHVGVTIILVLLSWRTRCKWLIALTVVGLILMNFATVYLRAHYVIDIFAGWVSALMIYAVLNFFARKFV